MNNRTDEVRDVLVWAAGGEVEPRFADLDPETVTAALRAHRLDGRFLRRSAAEPTAVPAEVTAIVSRRYAVVRERVQRRVELLRELGALVGEQRPGERVVMLKGFTLYALTGDPWTIRHSDDLDLVTPDRDALVQAALKLGFTLHGDIDEHGSEYARMSHPDHCLIEPHSYFPVAGLPERTGHADVDPARHPGAWRQQHHFVVRRIDHRALCGYAVEAPAVDGISVLRPEAAVLVHAAHIFVDLARYPLPLPIGTVRLDELATIRDLCGLPDFDWTFLTGLLDRYGGHLVIEAARRLLAALLHTDPFTGRIPRRPGPVPRNLWSDGLDGGFPADLGHDPREMLVRTTSMYELVDRIGATELVLGKDAAAAQVSLDCVPGGSARYVYRCEDGATFTVRYALRLTDDRLRVEVTVPAVPPQLMTMVAVYLQDYRYEFLWKGEGTPVEFANWSVRDVRDGDVRYRATRTGGVDRITADFSRESLGSPTGTLCLLLSTRQQRREWGPMTGGAVLPLRLTLC